MSRDFTSRISGFYTRSPEARLPLLREMGALDAASFEHLAQGGNRAVPVANRMIENVIGTHALPLGVALNFRVDDRDFLVPMAVEEPSVVAAASNAARNELAPEGAARTEGMA